MLSVERSISTPQQETLRSTLRVTARPNWAQIGLLDLLLGMGFYVIYPLLLILFNIYSFWGIVWVQLMAHAISFKVMLLTPAFRNMDAALEEAGRTSGADQWRTLIRVTLPVMTPMLAIVFLLGLVRLFESFEVEQLVGVPFGFYVYSTKIVQLVRSDPPQLSQAAALGSLTLVLLLIAAPLQRWLTMRRSFAVVGGRMKPALIELGILRWPVFAVTGAMTLLLVVVPTASITAASI